MRNPTFAEYFKGAFYLLLQLTICVIITNHLMVKEQNRKDRMAEQKLRTLITKEHPLDVCYANTIVKGSMEVQDFVFAPPLIEREGNKLTLSIKVVNLGEERRLGLVGRSNLTQLSFENRSFPFQVIQIGKVKTAVDHSGMLNKIAKTIGSGRSEWIKLYFYNFPKSLSTIEEVGMRFDNEIYLKYENLLVPSEIIASK